MTWRRLRPGEIDHEVIWLGVSLACLAGAWLWLHLALPLPGCVFHRVTGLPCPTCGMTRCLRYSFQHDWRAAARINPLGFLGYGAVAAYDIYAAIVVLFRLPRLRFDGLTFRTGQIVRFVVIGAIIVNWAWLIWIGV
ncbi:MAG TPA: DUF2752 domain-containing protein [Chthoniobacter sp.]|jgi:hypothetical protein